MSKFRLVSFLMPFLLGSSPCWAIDLRTLATGSAHTLHIKADGTVESWGSNAIGQLGDNTLVNKSAPVAVLDLTGVIAVAAGRSTSYAIQNDDSVWAWERIQMGSWETTLLLTGSALLG